ncbi:aminotransferase-like domain-containing protein [Dongshaea marina]|uniref:hypothetical protein n=1 Tax=Dongshaea marina TaxID=2047966 RepID=UPI001F316AC1|nr:hypothetical protein [Dongshaea marina]
MARKDPLALTSSSHPFGDELLREEIAKHLFEWRGIQSSKEQIVITAGSQDALELVFVSLLSRGDHIGLEDPGYLGLRDFSKHLELKMTWLPVRHQGAELPSLNSSTPKLLVLTPSHQFPLGEPCQPDGASNS